MKSLLILLIALNINFAQKIVTDADFEVTEVIIKEHPKELVARTRGYSRDSKNNIYIIDEFSKIFKFDKNGNYIKSAQFRGRGPKELVSPHYMMIDKNDNIYIDDLGSRKILVLNSNLDYKAYIQKESGALTDYCFWNDKLIIYDYSGYKNPISIYNLKNYKLENKFGEIDKYLLKYKENLAGGSINVIDNKIIYINPYEYELRLQVENNKFKKINKKIPKHFKLIEKASDPKNMFDIDYSSLIKIYIINKLIYVFSDQPIMNLKFQDTMCDVYNINGELLKEGLVIKNLASKVQLSNNDFIKCYDNREKYSENDPRSKIIFKHFKLKK